MEESSAAADSLAERRGAEVTLALFRNSDASSMVSIAVCLSEDPMRIGESMAFYGDSEPRKRHTFKFYFINFNSNETWTLGLYPRAFYSMKIRN
jgi:hypothetical protein